MLASHSLEIKGGEKRVGEQVGENGGEGGLTRG